MAVASAVTAAAAAAVTPVAALPFLMADVTADAVVVGAVAGLVATVASFTTFHSEYGLPAQQREARI
jgi:hypothetical protein